MLHEFLIANRSEILGRSSLQLSIADISVATQVELQGGLSFLLDEIIVLLGAGGIERHDKHCSVAAGRALHGAGLFRMGLSVGQVVLDFGSICQSVMEIAAERDVPITADEFHTFNRCLDDAIAQAVTVFEHDRERAQADRGLERLGFLAHEMRNLLTTSMLTFEELRRGSGGLHEDTGALLGRSLARMRMLIDRTLADVRLSAATQTRECVLVAELIEEIEAVATLEAQSKGREILLSFDVGPGDVAVQADRQNLAAVFTNLVQNALKFTRPGGHITIRTYATLVHVFVDVEDECGGLPPGKAEELFRPFEQRGKDRTGLGLGLTISQEGVRANGGEIHVRDKPGSGCVFTVDLPRANRLT